MSLFKTSDLKTTVSLLEYSNLYNDYINEHTKLIKEELEEHPIDEVKTEIDLIKFRNIDFIKNFFDNDLGIHLLEQHVYIGDISKKECSFSSAYKLLIAINTFLNTSYELKDIFKDFILIDNADNPMIHFSDVNYDVLKTFTDKYNDTYEKCKELFYNNTILDDYGKEYLKIMFDKLYICWNILTSK